MAYGIQNSTYDIVGEIGSHLKKCKKVLYTNGLHFVLLILEDGKVTIKELINLKQSYADYKQKKKLDILKKDITSINGWANEINWNKPPTVVL